MIDMSIHEGLLPLSTDYGGGENCIKASLPIERLFQKVAQNRLATDYLDGLFWFELWLRVAGTLCEFDGERGPRRLATGCNPPRLMIDLVIAKSDYVNVPQEEFPQFVGDRVEECFELMLARALIKNAVKDETKLRTDFGTAMQRF